MFSYYFFQSNFIRNSDHVLPTEQLEGGFLYASDTLLCRDLRITKSNRVEEKGKKKLCNSQLPIE